MSIDELFNEKSIKDVVKSLEEIDEEFKNLTKSLKRVLNPDERKKEDLFRKVHDLRMEADELTKKMEEGENSKDLHTIRMITDRVKQIVNEKLEIQKELFKLKLQQPR